MDPAVPSMSPVLVVYYSLEGNTKLVADAIAAATGATTLRLVPVKDLDPSKGGKYLWGGRQVVMRSKPALETLAVDPLAFDTIFIGTPVWAWTYTPAIRTFLSMVPLTGKRIAVFCTHEGGPKKAMEKLKKALAGNDIIGEKEFYKPLASKDEAEKDAADWARAVA